MRPRLIAVDDTVAGDDLTGGVDASMRPRLIAVDDQSGKVMDLDLR